jgi:hypothetical protein
MQLFRIRDDFPCRFYEEVGRLAVAFGRLEYLIKLCLKNLVDEGFTRGMAEAESQRQFSTLCKQAKQRAYERLNQEQARAFSALLDQATNLANTRNDVIHALWTTDPAGEPLRIRPRWDKARSSVDWSSSHVVPMNLIQDTRSQIDNLYRELETLRKRWPIWSQSE